MAKVSILMPACNVEKFIAECLESVIHQTLQDIEIICLDDGSTDGTGKILDDYAKKDDRIKVIHKPNSGYGHTMNVGLQNATADYIGIIETDDVAEADMFERLYQTAIQHDADVVKSNYYIYKANSEPHNKFREVLKMCECYDQVFSPRDNQKVFYVKPCIWSGIYKRKMLEEKHIVFTETPGASYQDTSFAFKVWACAERVVLVKEAFLHYRSDNENSSVKSSAKIFCICDEYMSTEAFLKNYFNDDSVLVKIKNGLKFNSYNWNLERLAYEYKYAFLLRMYKELSEANEEGMLEAAYFQSERRWKNACEVLEGPDKYFNTKCKEDLDGFRDTVELIAFAKKSKREIKKLKKQNEEIKQSMTFKIGKIIMFIPGKIKGLFRKNDRDI